MLQGTWRRTSGNPRRQGQATGSPVSGVQAVQGLPPHLLQGRGLCPAAARQLYAVPQNLRRKRRQAPYRQMSKRQSTGVLPCAGRPFHARPPKGMGALGKAPCRKIWVFRQCRVPMQGRRLLRKARRTGILHSQPRRTAAETLYRQRQGGLLFRQPQDQRRRPERRRLPAWFKMQDRATRNPAILWAARQIRQAQEMPGFPTLAEIRQTALFCTTAWQTSGAARLPLPTIQRGIQAGRKIPRTAKIFLSGIARQAANKRQTVHAKRGVRHRSITSQCGRNQQADTAASPERRGFAAVRYTGRQAGPEPSQQYAAGCKQAGNRSGSGTCAYTGN